MFVYFAGLNKPFFHCGGTDIIYFCGLNLSWIVFWALITLAVIGLGTLINILFRAKKKD